MLFSQTSKATSRADALADDMKKKKQKQDDRMARTFVDNVIETTQQEINRSLVSDPPILSLVSEDMHSNRSLENQLMSASQSSIEHRNQTHGGA